ncbi:MAG: hypothetical protein JNK77_14145 [Saprospiraceae bacterium]|nr:hypothetical protein [Saprospiraceae bacterium]
MRKYLYFILLFLTISCANKEKNINREEYITQEIDTLKFMDYRYNHGLNLNLLSDGRFINERYSYGCMGGGNSEIVYGRYTMDSIKLTLFPERIELINYGGGPEALKYKMMAIPYIPDSFKIKTEYQVVSWNSTKYLLSDVINFRGRTSIDNDYTWLAYYINAGLEPEETYGPYLASRVLGKDTIKSKFDLNQIPEKWRFYFLKEPISAKIINAKKIITPGGINHYTWSIQLDKGENDGVTNRLFFQSRDGKVFFDIDSVLSNRSFGTADKIEYTPSKYPFGTELRTKWE